MCAPVVFPTQNALLQTCGLHMALNVVISESAQAGLAEACAYIAEVLKEPSAVVTLLDALDEFVDAVSQLPDLYPLCNEQRLAGMGFRKALIRGYIALYIRNDKEVSVIAFFHQTQDYAKLI